jgi:hypothetical protein
MENQNRIFNSTADSPQGDTTPVEQGLPSSAEFVVPKGWEKREEGFPAMTMEEIASEENLKRAFKKVKANRGEETRRDSSEDCKASAGGKLPTRGNSPSLDT